ncbi:MAG: amino acid permease [Spirochaetales bacterium]
MDNTKNKKTFGVFTLAMINVAAIVSLRGLPSEAVYGLSSVFYYVFAAVCFLIPVSLISAEMGTGWQQKGGVFRWVGEAFGPFWGFLAIFLQWIQNTIWFPTALTFAAVSLAFIDPNQSIAASLAANKYYTLAIVLVVYWAATIINFFGVKFSGAISKWGVIVGTLIPGAFIIILGILYLAMGNPSHIAFDAKELIPDITKFGNLSLAVSIFLFYAGMEMSSVHVKDIDNPKKNYPKAILLASVITVCVFIVGTLAIGVIIPSQQINLTQSLLVAYYDVLDLFHLKYIASIIALCLAFGVFGQVSTWIAGPSKGLLAVGKAGYLPLWLQKLNKKGVQVNILIVQACIVTILSVMFVLLPSVQSAYQILSAMCVTLYLIMYILLFLSFIKLRISQPNVKRDFTVPGGTVGMIIIGGIGLIASATAFFFGFIPPTQIAVGSTSNWIMILIIGNLIGVLIPFVFYKMRKPAWKSEDKEDAFEPFSWEKKDNT